MILFSICDINTPLLLILGWFLPFILGGLFVWLTENKTNQKSTSSDYINQLNQQIGNLQKQLADCNLEKQGLKLKIESKEKASSPLPSDSTEAIPAPTALSKKENSNLDIFNQLEENNLEIVEGIGVKMKTLLHENGILNWADLGKSSSDEIRGILDIYGTKYRMIEPSTWPKQAKFAAEGRWNDLIAYQKNLHKSPPGSNTSDSKVEKVLIKKGILRKFKNNDLKAVEGIGPKIEQILHAEGITTWLELATCSIKKLNKILRKAGKRYDLADPQTWPEQAQMAADGKWDALRNRQNELKGGKPV